MKRKNDGKENGIKETLIELNDLEWKIIGGKKKWIKKCPDCGILMVYHYKSRLKFSIEKSRVCCRCYYKRPKSKSTLIKMSVAQRGRRHSKDTKLKMSGKNNGMFGIYRCGVDNPFYGKKHTDESIRKIRMAQCKNVLIRYEKTGQFVNVGKNEHKYFVNLESKMGWDGIFYGKNGYDRQYLIEPLGYFVDYFEPNLNIIVEYDEPRHYVCGKLKDADVKRMEDIKRHLNCKFYRYNERLNEFKEF